MTKIYNAFKNAIEHLELQKLKEKYEQQGYTFNKESARIFDGKTKIIFDAYAINPETKDEIFFEIKAEKSFKKGDTERLLKKRKTLLTANKNARFILVVARENPKTEFPNSELNGLLLKHIKKFYIKPIKKMLPNLISISNVSDLEISKIDLGDFQTINLQGQANLTFVNEIEINGLKGEALSDGIPFRYVARLVHSDAGSSGIYTLSSDSKVDFDFSEFTNNFDEEKSK